MFSTVRFSKIKTRKKTKVRVGPRVETKFKVRIKSKVRVELVLLASLFGLI